MKPAAPGTTKLIDQHGVKSRIIAEAYRLRRPTILSVWLVAIFAVLAGHAVAEPSIWNQYQGAGAQVQLGFANGGGGGVNFIVAGLAIPGSSTGLSSRVTPNSNNEWTLDTGSTGVVITADYLYKSFGISASQLTSIGKGFIKYTSSDLKYSGFYANLNVGLYNASGSTNGAPLAATSQVPVLVATSLYDGKTNTTTHFCPTPSDCTVTASSLEQFGVGFGRPHGPGSAANSTNPLLNLISVQGSDGQTGDLKTMAPGYVVTQNGVLLGLNSKQMSNVALVQLQPTSTVPTSLTNAYATAATKSDWSTPPMLLTITNNKSPYASMVNGSYYGTMLVDTGVNDAILSNGLTTGSNGNPGINQALITSSGSVTSMMLSLPGMTTTSGAQPGQFTYVYQGTCQTASTFGCGPYGQNYNGGNASQMVPIYPTSSKDSLNNGYMHNNTGFADTSGATAFLNTGVDFLNYFNIVYDPVSGFIGYQRNDNSFPEGTNSPAVYLALALQAQETIPDGTNIGLPVLLYTDIGNQATPSLVPVDVGLSAATASGVVTFEQPIASDSIIGCTASNCTTGVVINRGTFVFDAANTYAGQTTINPGATLVLGSGGSIAASSGLSANGTFDISGTSGGATIAALAGSGAVALGSQTLTIANANGSFTGVIADGGLSGGTKGNLTIAGGSETLGGVNTYTGATTVNTGAALLLTGAGSIASSSGVTTNGTFDISRTTAGATIASLNGGGTVNLGSQTLQLNRAAGTFSGTIGGTGGLSVTGGTQSLTGINTYTGGTEVSGGATLAVNSDKALGATSGTLSFNNGTLQALSSFSSNRSIIVGSGGGLVDAGTSSVTLAGPVSGAGQLATEGEVTLGGRIELSGVHLVSDGKTSVNGDLKAFALLVARSGILRGTGTVEAPLLVDGRLAPGNSPGTLTVAAPVSLTSGSTSEFDIDGTGTGTGAGNYSRLVVIGAGNTITVNGALAPLLRGITGDATNTYTPPLGQQFQIITATGGVLGSYGGLSQPAGLAAGTRFDAVYGANAITLVVTPTAYGNLGLAGLPETSNQAAVGLALDSARPNAGVAMTTSQASLYAPLYALPGSAIPGELEQLAPTIYGDALMARRDSWYLVSGAINEQLDMRRGLHGGDTAQSITDPGGRTVWVAGLGQFSNVSSTTTAGYSSSIGGTAAGVDVTLAPALTAGVAFGFANQSISAKNAASFRGDTFQFEVYGTYRQGIAFVDLQAGGGFSEGTATRPQSLYGVQATGNTNGGAGGGSLRGGVQLDAGSWRVEPSVTLAGVALQQGALSETLAGPVGMAVNSSAIGSLQSLFGVRAERRITISDTMAVVPSAQLGWLHEYLDTAGTTTASFIGTPGLPFTAQSAPISRNAAVVGVRAVLETKGPLALYASYTGAIRGTGSAQTVSAGFRFIW